jgi:hypothetical protein
MFHMPFQELVNLGVMLIGGTGTLFAGLIGTEAAESKGNANGWVKTSLTPA